MGREQALELIMHLAFLLFGLITGSQAFFGGFFGGGNQFCNGKDCRHLYNFRPCSYHNPANCVCSASSATCPSDGKTWAKASDGSKCYVKMTGQTSWADAQVKCTAAGYKGLATITNTEQDAAVKTLVTNAKGAYIGLGDAATEGTFLWNDGSNTNSHTNWFKNVAPTANTNQNCVKMRQDGTWQAVGCKKSDVDFICEQKPTC